MGSAENNSSPQLGASEIPVDGITAANFVLNGVATPLECEGYRLPTESEWEYAARAGSITPFHPSDGNDGSITDVNEDPNMDQIGWYQMNSDYSSHPVGSKEPNAWGLYDMAGNVLELVWDGVGPYPEGDTAAPVVDPTGPATASMRASRSGGYNFYAQYCRSGFRNGGSPGYRAHFHGFRLARTTSAL